ncbi:MAG: GAF domain-containing protein [Roseiflexaceae bacterium]
MATILVVDDHPTNRAFLTTLLGYAGYLLHEAADGAEALEAVRAVHPDLVIADVLMPMMDGYEFVRRLRVDPAIAHTPVIFCTATYSEREAQVLARDCGVEHVLLKPVPADLILRTVTAILAQASLAPVPAALPPADTFDRAHTRLLINKLAAKVDQLTVVNNQLVALLDVSQRLATERDPDTILQICCDTARKISGASYAALDVRSAEQPLLRHFHTSGLAPQVVADIGEPPMYHGLFAQLIADGQPLRTPNIRADPRAVGFPPAHPSMTSFLGVPIASATWRYGILYLADKIGATEFSDEDEQVATMLASQLAVAYENAQRYDALQRHAAAIDQEIAECRQVESQRDQLLAQEQFARAAAERTVLRTARLQAVTAACSEALTLDQVAEVIMDQGITLAGATSGLIALLTDDGLGIQIVCTHGYPPDAVAAWQSIPIEAAVPLTEAVRTGEPIWIEAFAAIAERYPQLAASRTSSGTRALIAIPLIAHGQALGSIGLSFTQERVFAAEDRAFILDLTRQYAQAIDRARLYQETQAAARRAEEALAVLESLVQTAPVGFAFLDDQLRYRIINTNLAAFDGMSIDAHLGRTVSEVLPELGSTLEPLLRNVLATGKPVLNHEISGSTAANNGRVGRWMISYYLVRTRSGQALGLGTIVNDISARKRADDRQATQFAVTRIIAESENRYDAIPSLLAAICRGIDWDLGEFWRVNIEQNLLSWENDWHTSPFDDSAFLTANHVATFAHGIGLPGRVWASGQPEWVDNIAALSLPRAAMARAAGFHSTFAFPILGAGNVLGVMVFFSRQSGQSDQELLITMADIGSQIGQFFERAQTEERLWQYTQRLKTLHTLDQAILAAQSPEAIAQAALRHMRELAPCRAATVSVFDFASHEAIVLAVESSATMPFQRGSHLPLDVFLSFPNLQQGQLFIMDDLQESSDPATWHQLAIKDGLRSYLSVPIISQDTLIGALTLFSDRPRAFAPEVIDVAREVGIQLAVAIQNARLFEQVRAGAESLRLMSQQLVRAQEDERRHIARELHDEVGQSLTAALLNLQVMVNLPDPNELPARLEDSMAQIERVLQQIRTLSLNLRPALLDDLGLAPALRWLVGRQAERTGFVATFNANVPDERFAADIETTCFRAVQEAITNIVRYAQARHVTVVLLKHDAELCVGIRDDGVGFDVAAALQRASQGHSMGLLSMQERVLLLGGQMRIESAPGQGALIEVCLPLALPAAEVPVSTRSNLP